jgi:hypothetical protein
VTDAAIHRVSKDAYGLCGSVTGSQWIATGISQYPRDDNALCHCEEQRDAAIHRVSRYAFGECGSLTEGQWIATGCPLAMTRW